MVRCLTEPGVRVPVAVLEWIATETWPQASDCFDISFPTAELSRWAGV